MQSLLTPALGSQICVMVGMVTQLHFEAAKPALFMGENTMYNGSGSAQEKLTAVAIMGSLAVRMATPGEP